MRRFPHLWLALLLAGVTFVTFLPVAYNDFVDYDDNEYIFNNEYVKAGLSWEGLAWAFRTRRAANWHPLTWASLQLDAELFGPGPRGFHLSNLALHCANTVLLFLALRRLTGHVAPCALVAGLFGLHPLHVESVAWAAERKDTLSTLFWILTLWAYAAYAERPTRGRYLLVFLALALGLLAKPMLVTLPCVLLLLDYWPLRRLSFGGKGAAPLRKLVVEKLPLFALVIASCVVTVYVQRRGGAVRTFEEAPLPVRFGNAAVAYATYLAKTVWPRDLAVFYPHPRHGLPLGQAAGAGLFLAAVTAWVAWLRNSRPYLAVGWLWYLGTLVPVIGLVQVGDQALADRYTYVPLIGIFVLFAWGAPDLLARWRLEKVLGPAAVLVLLACAAASRQQTSYWRDDYTLWKHALDVTHDNYYASHKVGHAILEASPGEALPYLLDTVRIRPDYPAAQVDLALAYVRLQEPARAVEHLYQALAVYEQRGAPPHFAIYSNLGNIRLAQGRWDEAAEHYRATLGRNPDHAGAHNGLGEIALQKRQPREARQHFAEAVRLAPQVARYHYHLAAALVESGEAAQAEEVLRAARQIAPEWAKLNLVAPARDSLGRYDPR